jgi:hypothetical protein
VVYRMPVELSGVEQCCNFCFVYPTVRLSKWGQFLSQVASSKGKKGAAAGAKSAAAAKKSAAGAGAGVAAGAAKGGKAKAVKAAK